MQSSSGRSGSSGGAADLQAALVPQQSPQRNTVADAAVDANAPEHATQTSRNFLSEASVMQSDLSQSPTTAESPPEGALNLRALKVFWPKCISYTLSCRLPMANDVREGAMAAQHAAKCCGSPTPPSTHTRFRLVRPTSGCRSPPKYPTSSCCRDTGRQDLHIKNTAADKKALPQGTRLVRHHTAVGDEMEHAMGRP